MCVLDPKVVSQAMKQAADKGVWFVQFAGCEPGLRGIGISIDDADLGRAAGKFAANLINRDMSGSAKVVILDYPDLPNTVARADAIESTLKELAPGAVIVGRFMGGTREKGLASLEAALQANPDINVVVSINDAGAYGAMMALKAAGKDPAKTAVIGIDAEKEALKLVKEGGMYRAPWTPSPRAPANSRRRRPSRWPPARPCPNGCGSPSRSSVKRERSEQTMDKPARDKFLNLVADNGFIVIFALWFLFLSWPPTPSSRWTTR